MSFYRSFIAAAAALGLATAVFAADEAQKAQNPANAAPAAKLQTADASSTSASGTEQNLTQEKVNINQATAKDLMKIKGMTSGKAKAIVSYRKKHGDFKSLDELKEVKGFKKLSEKTMQEIQSQLTIG